MMMSRQGHYSGLRYVWKKAGLKELLQRSDPEYEKKKNKDILSEVQHNGSGKKKVYISCSLFFAGEICLCLSTSTPVHYFILKRRPRNSRELSQRDNEQVE